MTLRFWWLATLPMLLAAMPLPAETPPPGLEAMLAYPFVNELVAAEKGDRIAWLTTVKGVRNVWTATAPGFAPRQVTRGTADDGQELTGLTFSPDGIRLAWVRGGDHDANWPAEGGVQPNPADALEQPKLTIWTALAAGGTPVKVAEGDHPKLSATGRLAYVKDGQVWTAPLDGGKAKPERLFYDAGKDADLTWSPNGTKLAFVSHRRDHNLIGVYDVAAKSVTWLTPSTGQDEDPVWSPDGRRVAFTRRPGAGGAPEPMLVDVPHPWSIRVADAVTGEGREVWHSPRTLDGSFPDVPGGVGLAWAAGDKLSFRAELDGWAHLYAVAAGGGKPVLLTPGKFIVENVKPTADRHGLLYTANTGPDASDDDRRHIYRVDVDGGTTAMLTPGTGLEFLPVPVGSGLAYVAVTGQRPASVHVASAGGDRAIDGAAPYPAASLVVPQRVTFTAADGLTIHGQLFATAGNEKKPAVIFVHGGPPRQMLLGWSYMDYYSNAYAVNQYLAAHGFVVLSVNYRLGIGYGRAFQHPAKGGPAGASEYQDVVAGAKYLQSLPGVDPARIGIWGGSYGGYLTGLALARNSDIFKAGVDLHGVHDWSRLLYEEAAPAKRYEQGDWLELVKTAFTSSPDADVATWKSPVLLIQGDDDRNVRFNQTIDLARRLDAVGVPYDELVLPNEIHGFLRYDSWLKADSATVRFLEAKLKP
ncbi:prolyl oligopeptidase family serine peptidase [Glacieibacterium megasporae]|uniref:prolyl oligopeptidase family serine peptidase n=1 Tax=Glacieibacterium megasporae TaxID=2835787 RepID=UPI001C1E823F|nr:prolyl oligopeptidase family serine peptidase [Polymorphobacter megasporae]UAJ10845.1 prolyl oligopeptidase family serine peptidase [Polymorphobacter megasporae]